MAHAFSGTRIYFKLLTYTHDSYSDDFLHENMLLCEWFLHVDTKIAC